MKLPVPVTPIKKEKELRSTFVTDEEIAQFKKDMNFINEQWGKSYTFIPGYDRLGATAKGCLWTRYFYADGSSKDSFLGWDPYKEAHKLVESDD